MINILKSKSESNPITNGLILALLCTASLAFVFQRFIAHNLSGSSFDWYQELISNTIIFASMGIFIPLIRVASDHYPITKKNAVRNITLHVLFALLFAGMHLFLISNINSLRFSDISFGRMARKIFLNFFHIQIICYWAMLGLILTLRTSQKGSGKGTVVLTIKSGKRIIQIPTKDIQILQSFDHYVKIYDDSSIWVSRGTVKEITMSLNSNFIRVHRSAVINRKHIKQIYLSQNGRYEVTMKNGQRVFSSKRYRQVVKDLLR